MVAYVCHHLSVNYDDSSDLYVDLSVINVDLSDKIITTKNLIFGFYSVILPLTAIYFSI